jgi:hypothetical protein
MIPSQVRRIGFWSGIVLVAMGLAYLGLIAAMMLSGSGFPPVEPFQTMFNILVLFTAVWMVLFWSILHLAVPADRKVFSQASLALIVIFAALTSINRYVGLTVVRQSISSGNTNGLQWFLPYGWPSVMLALEYLAWGFFFGLACLCLAPVFNRQFGTRHLLDPDWDRHPEPPGCAGTIGRFKCHGLQPIYSCRSDGMGSRLDHNGCPDQHLVSKTLCVWVSGCVPRQ